MHLRQYIKSSTPLFVLTVFLSFLLQGCGQDAKQNDGGIIKAKFASEEIEGDFMTVWAHRFSEHMKGQSNQKIDITVYPYGSLGDTRDINELAQLGVVDFVFTDFAWVSSFVPEAQVLALHYVWPKENTAEVLEWVVRNGEFMPQLEQAFRKKKLVPLAIMYEGWQWMTAKNEAKHLEDLAGKKVRLMGSKMLVEQYRKYGLSPTPMSYGEVYGALQTGLIDAQVNPLFADYSMKFYEVTSHFTQMWAEPFLGIPTVNRDFFDRLPEETQMAMREFFISNIVNAGKWIDERNAQDRQKIIAEKPSITWTEWSDADVAKAKSKVVDARDELLAELAGDQAVDLLNLLLKDIEKAKLSIPKAPTP